MKYRNLVLLSVWLSASSFDFVPFPPGFDPGIPAEIHDASKNGEEWAWEGMPRPYKIMLLLQRGKIAFSDLPENYQKELLASPWGKVVQK